MSILLGTTKIKELKLGETDVQRAYMGETLVYEKTDPRGWWVHKTTGVKTYFDASASFIVNGVMDQPGWIQNAKEIRLCAGITDFKNKSLSNTPMYTYTPASSYSDVFTWLTSGNYRVNTCLQTFDFGAAAVENIYVDLFYGCHDLRSLILNRSVKRIMGDAYQPKIFPFFGALIFVDIPSSVISIEKLTQTDRYGTKTVFKPFNFNNLLGAINIVTDAGNVANLTAQFNAVMTLPSNVTITERQ